jgi:diaminohydroxyphosphoribosylaminopyrimidine deaminase/5-amino-6-(5-phosphoribosylamino)uracil reductase
LTGIGTVLADDPALNARPEEVAFEVLQPLRVILDSTLRTPPAAATLALPGEVIVFAGADTDPTMTQRRQQLETRGARIETVSGIPSIDLAAVAQRLGALAINTVWLEAGPRLAGAMLAAGLVDELVLYLAPCLLGSGARGLFELPTLTRLEDRYALDVTNLRQIGNDLRICARIKGT